MLTDEQKAQLVADLWSVHRETTARGTMGCDVRVALLVLDALADIADELGAIRHELDCIDGRLSEMQ